MTKLILEGDLALTKNLEEKVREELRNRGIEGRVTVDAEIVPVPVGPGDVGFGEEIRQLLLGLSDFLKAVPDATVKVAEGIKDRLSQGSAEVSIEPGGVVRIKVRGSAQGVPEIAREVATVVAAAGGQTPR